MGEDDLFDDALAKDNKMKEKERYVNATIADLDEDNTENSLENIKKEDNVCNDANYEKTDDKIGNKSVSDSITAHVEITNDPKDLEESKNHENKYKDRADVDHANLLHNCANIPQPSETSLEQIEDQTPTNNFVIEDEDENINTGKGRDKDGHNEEKKEGYEDDLVDDALAKDNKMEEKERHDKDIIADQDEDNTENSLENITKEDNVCNDANYEKTDDSDSI